MAAPKPQSTGELSHVCFCPYLSPTALCWVSVTAAPKAFWLLTPRDRCGELWALAMLQETRHSRRAHTLSWLKPQISSNKRPNWEDILAFSQQRRRGSHHHLSLPQSQWELVLPGCSCPGHTVSRQAVLSLHVYSEYSIPPPINFFPGQQGLVNHHTWQERRTWCRLSSHGREPHNLHHWVNQVLRRKVQTTGQFWERPFFLVTGLSPKYS